ncbi:MAG: hypothetical protein LBB55_04085 [Zoogloeaceae bacterium]|jgi:hypothetical protein|nr:hypothetical protein [Zoogloeaceae bacterium]
MTGNDKTMNCRDCLHFFITHEARLPYGCRAMNFKSRRLPSLDVEAMSHSPCLQFQPRARQSPSGR